MEVLAHHHVAEVECPIGVLYIQSDDSGLLRLSFHHFHAPQTGAAIAQKIGKETAMQLNAYFNKKLTKFSLPLHMVGTDFQRQVWSSLLTIEYGHTCSYMDIARKMNHVKAIRAIGTANGANPIAIIVPCHRVIGTNGSLTGYGGGLERKMALLELENPQSQLKLF